MCWHRYPSLHHRWLKLMANLLTSILPNLPVIVSSPHHHTTQAPFAHSSRNPHNVLSDSTVWLHTTQHRSLTLSATPHTSLPHWTLKILNTILGITITFYEIRDSHPNSTVCFTDGSKNKNIAGWQSILRSPPWFNLILHSRTSGNFYCLEVIPTSTQACTQDPIHYCHHRCTCSFVHHHRPPFESPPIQKHSDSLVYVLLQHHQNYLFLGVQTYLWKLPATRELTVLPNKLLSVPKSTTSNKIWPCWSHLSSHSLNLGHQMARLSPLANQCNTLSIPPSHLIALCVKFISIQNILTHLHSLISSSYWFYRRASGCF